MDLLLKKKLVSSNYFFIDVRIQNFPDFDCRSTIQIFAHWAINFGPWATFLVACCISTTYTVLQARSWRLFGHYIYRWQELTLSNFFVSIKQFWQGKIDLLRKKNFEGTWCHVPSILFRSKTMWKTYEELWRRSYSGVKLCGRPLTVWKIM